MSTLSIPVITDQSEKLNPHLQPNTYYIRYVQHVLGDSSRVKRILIVTDKMISLIEERGQGVRDIDIRRLFGVILQNKGRGKTELHILLEVDGDADLMFVQHVDPNNGNWKQALCLENALTAIIAGWGLNLPVATLREGQDDMTALVRWHASPDVRLRHQLTESLAYRSELQSELDTLRKRGQMQEISIMQMKGSAEGQQVSNFHDDIKVLEGNVEKFHSKIAALNERKAHFQTEKNHLNDELQEEEKRRNEAIRDKSGNEQHEMLMRRTKENELLKAAHKREVDKVNFLTDLYEQHAQSRNKDTYSGVDVTMRLEELEEELDILKTHKQRQEGNHKHLMTMLGEVKKRMASAKALNERISEELKILEETSVEKSIPDSITRAELPQLAPVQLEQEEAVAPAKVAPASPAKKPVALESDDDDDLPMAKAPPAKKAPIALDSDDDI